MPAGRVRAGRMRLGGDVGGASAEFAVALPAVVLVLALALGGVQVAALQVRAHDAAADAARSLARGESSATISARLARQLPGASFVRSTSGDLVCVRVTARARGPLATLGVSASARSCALAGGR